MLHQTHGICLCDVHAFRSHSGVPSISIRLPDPDRECVKTNDKSLCQLVKTDLIQCLGCNGVLASAMKRRVAEKPISGSRSSLSNVADNGNDTMIPRVSFTPTLATIS